jgi:hypothetical protein
MSFASLTFTYLDSEEGQKVFTNWDELQDLMNHVFIAEFQADKANQNCKSASLAVVIEVSPNLAVVTEVSPRLAVDIEESASLDDIIVVSWILVLIIELEPRVIVPPTTVVNVPPESPPVTAIVPT